MQDFSDIKNIIIAIIMFIVAVLIIGAAGYIILNNILK
ncbi:MAG: hypothetical protein KatS3mg002_0482 [Candidatus Woesearchaeota archaeon]|nr:MAG: hypothetical protein KatS3mg002_0482 [Candidatus Woesearchaeota archaeon]